MTTFFICYCNSGKKLPFERTHLFASLIRKILYVVLKIVTEIKLIQNYFHCMPQPPVILWFTPDCCLLNMKNEAYDYGQAVRKSQGTKGHVGKGCVSVVFPDGDV